ICSPFSAAKEFDVQLLLPGREADISGLPSVGNILAHAFSHFSFDLSDEGFSWRYRFTNQISGLDIANREVNGTGPLVLDDRADEPAEVSMPQPRRRKGKDRLVADREFLKGICPISGDFIVFGRDKEDL